MEAAHESTDPQGLRDVIGKFRDGLIQEDAWDCLQHLFAPNADKHEILDAIVHCHFASFELGDEYLHRQKGSAHIDSCIRCLLGKLTSEARDSMLKDFPVLMRDPKPAENTELLLSGFPSLVLTLSETGLRLPLDARHAGNHSGDGGLRTQETEHLLARLQGEKAKPQEIEPDGARTLRAAKDPATHTDLWLTGRLRKFQPSFSTRRDSDFSLNGQVEVDKELIVCRHIARLWEEDFLRTAGKPTYQTLNSPAVLQEAAGPVLRYDGSYLGGVARGRLDGAQYWMSTDWGQVLTDNFGAMSRQSPKDGAVCRTLYLMTPNHVMAVGLKIKDEADARRYVVQFYDPNRTVAHQRSAITATLDQPGVPAEIRTLKPRDFLSEGLQKDYLLIDAENRSIPAIFAGEKVEPGVSRFAGDLPVLQEQVMRAMLVYNLPDQLRAYTDQLKLADNPTRLKILTGKDYAGNPGLFIALQRGHTEVVEALGDILKACQPPLSPAQLMVLLSAQSPYGTPGLSRALQQGYAETVEAFGRLLNTCEPPLSSEQLMDLLSAKDNDGYPGLYDALHNGHDKTVEAFTELLKACQPSLSAAQLMDLLSAKDELGVVGLRAALQNGRAHAIVAYGKLLETVAPSLPAKQVAELFAAASGPGLVVLLTARRNGHAAAVKAFEALRVKFAHRA